MMNDQRACVSKMTRVLALTLTFGLVLSCASGGAVPFKLDYDQVIPLDAEDLAEGGISRAYKSLLPKLSQYVSQPAEIEEVIDDKQPSYAVRYRDREYRIYSPEGQQDESWGRAAYALFSIVNDQLEGSSYHLYAIGGGNDLGGIFLTLSECEAARKSLPRKMDWPYLPTLDDSWYGQYHD